MFYVPSKPGENRSERCSEFSQTLPKFLPGYEGQENMFYKIIIFRLKKEKDDILTAFV